MQRKYTLFFLIATLLLSTTIVAVHAGVTGLPCTIENYLEPDTDPYQLDTNATLYTMTLDINMTAEESALDYQYCWFLLADIDGETDNVTGFYIDLWIENEVFNGTEINWLCNQTETLIWQSAEYALPTELKLVQTANYQRCYVDGVLNASLAISAGEDNNPIAQYYTSGWTSNDYDGFDGYGVFAEIATGTEVVPFASIGALVVVMALAGLVATTSARKRKK